MNCVNLYDFLQYEQQLKISTAAYFGFIFYLFFSAANLWYSWGFTADSFPEQ